MSISLSMFSKIGFKGAQIKDNTRCIHKYIIVSSGSTINRCC